MYKYSKGCPLLRVHHTPRFFKRRKLSNVIRQVLQYFVLQHTYSLLHVVSINLWLKKFTENVYTCSTDQGIKQCYTGYIQLIYYSQWYTICTFIYQWFFFFKATLTLLVAPSERGRVFSWLVFGLSEFCKN